MSPQAYGSIIALVSRYSMLESKRVFWQFEIEGQEDETVEEIKQFNATVEEYRVQSQVVKKAVGLVSSGYVSPGYTNIK